VSTIAYKTELLLKNAFQVSKFANDPGSYDSIYDYSLEEQRFAIADSASESLYSRLWAKTLATGLVATAPFQFLESEQDLVEWLEPMQMAWKKIIEWEQSPQIASNQVEVGSLSSLLGLQILEPEPVSPLPGSKPADEQMRWQAFAIGNNCLFQIRRNHLNAAFPISHSSEFASVQLISSTPNKNQQIWRQFHQCQDVCYETDVFLLMNDSLAQWFLIEFEQGRKPWADLYHLQTQEEFQNFVTELKNSGRLRSTDVTLLTFQIGQDDISISPANFNVEVEHVEHILTNTVDTNSLTTPLSADAQKGTTFLVKEASKAKEREPKEPKEPKEPRESTAKHKAVQKAIKPPQFSSLDQPSMLKQISKSIIGFLGKKEGENEE
jgi:hypothetical protein